MGTIIRIVEAGKMHGEATITDETPIPAVNDCVVADSGLVLMVKERVFRYVPTGGDYHYLLIVLSCVPTVVPEVAP